MSAPINKNEFAFKLPEMLSYHSTWDDADYQPALPRQRRNWLPRVVTGPMRVITKLAERHRVMNELARLSDRELADLGMSRYDIPRVFDTEFAAEHAGRGIGRS
ncbi:MAG TPA: DUF1127 domain-containing protein [Acetobacteraceae bacterium]|nr:DUF1127 domain-containing protein [Acetobacteraceae bacterium]